MIDIDAGDHKVCTRCGVWKNLFEFRKSEKRQSHSPECKSCLNERQRIWRQNNPERDKELAKRSREKNSEKLRALNAEWRAKNADYLKKAKQEYYQKTKEANRERKNAYQREYEKARRTSDVSFALHSRMSRSIRGCLAGNEGKAGRAWQRLVGYTLEELISHIEKQFLPKMSWDNRNEWHIDHIVPLAEFKISTAESPEFRQAWALTNLRPLWASQNIAKKDSREFLL